MKQTKILFGCFFTIFSLFSCESYLGGDFNADPNNPVEVPIAAQIPSIQINLVDVYGGQFSRNNNQLMQQVEGVARQCTGFNSYSGLVPSRFSTVWTNIYENILNEIKIAQKVAAEEGYAHYTGMLNIMEAYTLMISTDVWDDMPYVEAFQGINNLNPRFDTQATIYEIIFNLLDESITLLQGGDGGLAIGNDDVYYEGDIGLWIKAAYAIKARGLLKHNKFAEAQDAAKLSFTSPDENLGFLYPDQNAAAPWYRYNRDRTGDIEFHPQMGNLMQGLNDTARLNIIQSTFRISHPYMTAKFHQELISYREMQFLIAETDLWLNQSGTAEGYHAYLEGIKASFKELNLPDSDYEIYVGQSDIDPGMGNLDIEDVMIQKYIGLYLCPEVYSDWRRTNIPKLTPVTGRSVPVRWEYSADEYSFNLNAPEVGSVNIFSDRVGWNR